MPRRGLQNSLRHDRSQTINGWLTIPSSLTAEAMANQGWQSLTIDMQHGLIDYQAAVGMLTAISTTNVTPLVRVPSHDPAAIMQMLDAGAYGIICPLVNSADDAHRLASACRYPPGGTRSFGPIRAQLSAGGDYASHANDRVAAFAMIETSPALDNLDEILSVHGLDGIYIGPADLSMALGCSPAFDQEEKAVVEAIDHILQKTLEKKLVPGIHTVSSAYALKMLNKGFQFVTLASDLRLMRSAAAESLSEILAGLASRD